MKLRESVLAVAHRHATRVGNGIGFTFVTFMRHGAAWSTATAVGETSELTRSTSPDRAGNAGDLSVECSK